MSRRVDGSTGRRRSRLRTVGIKVSFTLVTALLVSFLWAGGPVVVLPEGLFFRWNPQERVPFTIDPSPLGPLSSAQAAELVRESFRKWEDVPSSTLRFDDRGFFDEPITAENFEAFFDDEVRSENPIVFDSDGGIIDSRLGEGASDSILGFASPRFINPATRHIVSARVVLNGKFADRPFFDQVVTHEIGHLIGLDHTQANNSLASSVSLLNRRLVPLMYPRILDGGPKKPIRDDIAWLSWMYPTASFPQQTGTIRGRALRGGGTPLSGANVMVIRVAVSGGTIAAEFREDVVSVVSDFLLTTDGSFELPGLPPGDYLLLVEPLDSRFTEGGGVGPFDQRFTRFERSYYDGGLSPGSTSTQRQVSGVLSVAPGEVIDGIDLRVVEVTNRLDLLEDDDEMLFVFPEGFTFPFFGVVYDQVYVNSDGNLTFGRGDGLIGQARSQERFLSGPPRIAPLFTDLDPSAGGEVEADFEPGRLTFTWNGVPEFVEEGQAPGNLFSVTLYSTGDIRFRYDKVEVTPDPLPGFAEGLHSIVGITPGGGVSGAPRDLVEEGGFFQIGVLPIFQVFPGDSFNLEGEGLFFEVSESELLFPFYQGQGAVFSGYAVTNVSEEDARLGFEAFGREGALLPFTENPSTRDVPSRTQLAEVGSELFGIDPFTPQDGWIRARSNNPELASFFQFGDVVNKLDGSVAWTHPATEMFFTRIYQGPSTFPTFAGPRRADTWLSIANPGSEPVEMTLTLWSGLNNLVVTRTLPARGFLYETVEQIFGSVPPLSDGYIRLQAEEPGVVAFQLIELSDTVMGLNAVVPSPETVSFSAQLAHGTAGGSNFFTSIKLVNTSDSLRAVNLIAFRDDGTEIQRLSNVTLQPNQTFQRDAGEIFTLGPSTGPATVGSIRVESTGPGVVGDVVFGDPNTARFAAALPLQRRLFTRAVFSQVANGEVPPGGADRFFFTGLALYNPNSQSAQVTVRVFEREGGAAGVRQLTLAAGTRLSEVLAELVPESHGLLRGFIEVESNRPLVAQQLFGNASLTFLSAVPPKILE